MHSIVGGEKSYKIKTQNMEKGEKCICPEDNLEVEKRDGAEFLVTVKKGTAKKII